MIDRKEFLENIIDAFDCDGLVVFYETNFLKIPQWDSLSLVSIVAMLNCTYDVVVSAEQFRRCETVEDIYQLANSNIAEA